jgi:hypothetical protein
MGGLQFEASPSKKLVRLQLNKTSWVYNPSYAGRIGRRVVIQGQLRQKAQNPIRKMP